MKPVGWTMAVVLLAGALSGPVAGAARDGALVRQGAVVTMTGILEAVVQDRFGSGESTVTYRLRPEGEG